MPDWAREDEEENQSLATAVKPVSPSSGITDEQRQLIKKSIMEKYQAASDTADLEGAQKTNNNERMISHLAEGLEGFGRSKAMARGANGVDSGFYNGLRGSSDAKLAGERQKRKDSIDKVMQEEQLGQMEKDSAVKDANNKANASYNDPNSEVSKRAQMLYQTALLTKAKEAEQAGDNETATAIREQAKQAGTLSANEASSLYKGVSNLDYRDVLQNKRAEAAATAQFNRQVKLDADRQTAAEKKDAKAKYDRAGAIRKELNNNPQYKNAQEVEARLSQVDELVKDPNGTTDEALIVIYNKALDPGSVVREGEFARSAENAGALTKIDNYMSKIKNGERISPDQRKDLVNTMKALRDGSRSYMKRMTQPYEREIRDYDLDRNIIISGDAPIGGEKAKTETKKTEDQGEAASQARQKRIAELKAKQGSR
jgi:hypothetical protein